MVYGTRSRSKVGVDEDNASKNMAADGEGTPISGSRKTERSAQKTSSEEIITSPSTTRKSERLQKRTPPVTPTEGNSGRLEKLGTASPIMRSGKGKRNLLYTSSSSKLLEEESNPTAMKTHGKKEESLKQLMTESEKDSSSSNPSLSSIGKKRKRMNAYSHMLKMRRSRGNNKSKRLHKISGVVGSGTRNGESKLVGAKENEGNECHIIVADELIDNLAAQVHEGASTGVLEACPNMESLNIPDLVVSTSVSSEVNSESGKRGKIRTSKTHISNTEFEVTVADTSINMHKFIYGSAMSPSAGHEKHYFSGPCVACSKPQRVGYDSPKVELCSCLAMSNRDCDNLASPKDGVGVEAIVISGSAEKYSSGQSEQAPSDPHMDGNENVCAVCNQGGKNLQCNGKGCKRCYHLPSISSPIHDVLPGAWYCLWCLKKKVESGVHSVTKGVESIWDARELDVSGTHRQKHYLVKYVGLAHVHNHWVSEAQLLHEAPLLVATFNDKKQVARWKAEWTVPHRLLKKRFLSFSQLQGDCHNLDAGDNSECQCEWLVKWRDLDYENATWELENANFLCSPHGQNLIREYGIRQKKTKQVIDKNNKQSPVELSKIWTGSSLVTDIDVLNYVNKLQGCWFKSKNAAFFDDQEQIVKIVLFLLSMSTVCWPVLIITAPDAISQWEAEFVKWAPSVDFVVYHGSRETRKSIETLEFYSKGGCIMLQVLLTSLETAVEDIHVLNSLSWEVVIIDQCQHSEVSAHVEKIKTLAGLKVLLFNGPIKHTALEYVNLLSLVEPGGDLDKTDLLKSFSNDTPGKLKERFSWFTSYSSKWMSSEFLEYWLPVQISELQLELYCDTLLSNIDALCSYSKSDPVGALNDILHNVRKCCDHPYIILDPSMNPFSKGLSQAEILEIGIKASGKLQFLDKMLSEMKCQQLRTVILFQSFVGTTPSIGDILDDFLRQRFGENSYERVDAFLVRSKKDTALNMFNNVENGRFVFLLENRSCKPSIKLSSVDNVIIYGSDTNPLNDLRLLEKISFDSKTKQIKVFRLYSCFTVEEQALVMAKQEPDQLHSLNRKLNNMLMWGASDLFCRLDEYHAGESQTPTVNISKGELLLSDVIREFSSIISDSSEKADTHKSIISKVLHSSSHCTTDLPLFGEQKVKCTGEEPCVFWKSLLGGRNPRWRDISRRSPRNRKRVQFCDESQQTPEVGNNEVVKKCRKMNSGLDAVSVRQHEYEGGQLSASMKEPSTISDSNESLPTSVENSSLHIYLKAEMAKAFEVLKLSEDVKAMAEKFLEYVMENHRISLEPVNIFHALQISLCWTAASLLKEKVDKEKMLALTKEHLKFECTKDEAATVYFKLRTLKKNFLQHMKRHDSTSNSLKHSEAGKNGDTNKALVQPPLEEHILDEVLLVENANEISKTCDDPPDVYRDSLDVVVGCEHAAEANTIVEGSAKENFTPINETVLTNVAGNQTLQEVTPINRTGLTNVAGNQKEVSSNSSDGNQTLQEVASSDDGSLLPQNQCNDGTHLSESQSTSQIEAGQKVSNCEAILAKNSERQAPSDAGGCPPQSEVFSMTRNQEMNGIQSSRQPQSGTVIQPSRDSDSQDPLHNEFDRIRGELERSAKSHEELTLQLKSDCAKEIEETIVEIHKKYNARLQEAEARYSLRKKELGGNLKKVLLNKLLADTFRSKCLDVKPSRVPAVPTSYMQHLRQVSTQPTLQSASLTGLSLAGQQNSAPACVGPPLMASSSAREQNSASASTRLPLMNASPSSGQQVAGRQASTPSKSSSPVVGESPRRQPSIASSSAGQQTPPPVWMRPPSIALSSGGQTGKFSRVSNRPPVISSITPSSGNPRFGGEIRTPAPHLQSFRPSISAGPSPVLNNRPSGTMVANSPSSSPFLNHSPTQPVVLESSQANNPNPQTQPSEIDISCLSATELLTNLSNLLKNLDNQASANQSKQSSMPVHAISTNLSSSSPLLHHVPSQPSVLESSRASQDKEQPQPLASNDFNTQNQPISALELLRKVDIQASANLPNDLPETGTNFSVADTSNLRTAGTVQEGSTSTPNVVVDVECLSDYEDYTI